MILDFAAPHQDHQTEIAVEKSVANSFNEFGEGRVVEKLFTCCGDQQGDRIVAPGGQRTGMDVRPVAGLRHRLPDGLL